MAELVTVYCTLPDDVSKIVRLLERHGLHPVIVDDPDKMSAYRGHEVRIAVPAGERDRAVAVLAEADRAGNARICELTKATNGVILILVAALGFVALIGIFDTQGAWFLGVSVALFAALAVVLIRWAWRKEPR
ncbi:MAG: hypothetical protein JW993_13320 [Sedimentisphaerales bacterium]|nr:hypothetical protein [Sedimentisphaerales bacterium]